MIARERLEALGGQLAARFDPDGFRFIERLLDAGLESRATARLDKLEEELGEHRRAALSAMSRLRERGVELDPALEAAVREGDYRVARRLAARAERELDAATRGDVPRWALTVAAKARARASRLPRGLETRLRALESRAPGGGPTEARAIAAAVSRALFDESMANARATVALARAADSVPESAGPYNTQALASQTLETLASLSPDYVASYVAMLDDLASLEALVAPPKPKASGRKSRAR